MSPATTIEFGQLRSRVGARGGGVVIAVDIFTSEARWTPVLKVDAFGGRPHWHIYPRNGQERVMDLWTAGETGIGKHPTGLGSVLAIIRNLPSHLSTAGYPDLATWLGAVGGEAFFRRIETEAEALTFH